MNNRTRLTPLAKIIIIVLILSALYFVVTKTNLINKIAPQGSNSGESSKGLFSKMTGKKGDTIKLGVVTWGGYAGGQYFNKGFAPNSESRFLKDYGFNVEFKVLDDFNASREAWKAGEVDLLWVTFDAFPTEINNLKEFDPKLVFQADWSRGGDAIVVQRNIKVISDLKNMKIAVAFGTPSHTFLLWALDSAGLSRDDVQIVEVPSAIDAAAMFKSNRVDAAVVWSPDDQDCVESVTGAKVLTSTKDATHIIADGFFAKSAWIEANKDNLQKLIEGWMTGAAEINTNQSAKAEAAKILAKGLNMPEDFCLNAINNVRLCNIGDNKNFFGLNRDYTGIKGEDLYNTMSEAYAQVGLVKGMTPVWRTVVDASFINNLSDNHPSQKAEEGAQFSKATADEETAESYTSKPVRISFASGQYILDENAKYIIEKEFVKIAKAFSTSRIRVEGNTDDTGAYQTNVNLSRKRAQSVVDFLVSEYGFDKNRFVVVGNGPDKPVAENNSEEGRAKNRRTDFELLK